MRICEKQLELDRIDTEFPSPRPSLPGEGDALALSTRAMRRIPQVEAQSVHLGRYLSKVLALVAVFLFTCVLLTGCSLGEEASDRLTFKSSVRLDTDENTHISIVVRNVGDRLYTDEEEIDGRGEVFNSAEQLLARFLQQPVERLAVDEEATLATWQGTLEPGTYLMRWTTPRYGGVELEFTLLKRFGKLEVGTVRERHLAPDLASNPS